MAGILDSKERLIDFILTQEGKRQAGIGQMRIEYATLTDYHTFYESELFEGEEFASDPGMRIFFEATNRYQDTIVPELVGGTVMNPIRTSEFLFDGKMVFREPERIGSTIRKRLVTGTQTTTYQSVIFANQTDPSIKVKIYYINQTSNTPVSISTINGASNQSEIEIHVKLTNGHSTASQIISAFNSKISLNKFVSVSLAPNSNPSEIQTFVGSKALVATIKSNDIAPNLLKDISKNFIDQKILSTEDPFGDSGGFIASPKSASMTLELNPIFQKASSSGITNIETAPSIFADKRFSHLPNFMFMPPVNSSNSFGESTVLAIYPKLNEVEEYTFDQIKSDVRNKDFISVTFEKTSRDNNLLCQWFESSPDNFEKLSIVDFGEFDDDNDITTPPKRVFFVGRIIKDKTGVETFLNIFTIIAENE